MSSLTDDLRERIRNRRVVAIVGAGVSLSATEGDKRAGWRGLLLDGVKWAETNVPATPSTAVETMRAQIESGDVDQMLAAAHVLTKKLGGRASGDYSRWLRESVGALRATDAAVLRSLVRLGIPLVTTNYDSLLSSEAQLPPVSWMDPPRVQRILQGDDSGIIHLHGHWQTPMSVVLGIESYADVLGAEGLQALLHAVRAMNSLLFVGCGQGLADPNFAALLSWAREAFGASEEYRHFRLVCDADAGNLLTVSQTDRIFDVNFGARHDGLADFLAGFAVETGPRARSEPAVIPAGDQEAHGEVVHLIALAHDRAVAVSRIAVEGLAHAVKRSDGELEKLCRKELSGYSGLTAGPLGAGDPGHRVVHTFVSLDPINPSFVGFGGNPGAMFQYMEARPKEFVQVKVIMSQSLSELESMVSRQPSSAAVLHWTQSATSINPSMPPEAKALSVHCYAQMSAYQRILDLTREKLAQAFLRRLPRAGSPPSVEGE